MATFNSTNIKEARADLEVVLRRFEEKYKVKFNIGRITYDSDSLRCKIEAVKTESGESVAESKMKKDWSENAALIGLKVSDLGKTFFIGANINSQVIVKGIKPRNHRYPVIVETPNGKLYKISASLLKSNLE